MNGPDTRITEDDLRQMRRLVGFSELRQTFHKYNLGLSQIRPKPYRPSDPIAAVKRKPRPKQIKRKRHKPTRR